MIKKFNGNIKNEKFSAKNLSISWITHNLQILIFIKKKTFSIYISYLKTTYKRIQNT